MQIKMTTRFCLTSVKVVKQEATSIDKHMEELEPLYTVGGNAK